MRTTTLKNFAASILISFIIISSIISPDQSNGTVMFSVTTGVNVLGAILIGAILYLGYYARNRYEEHQKTRNEKS